MEIVKDKIHTLESVYESLSKVRAGKKVVMCHGVFDLLHIGHIRHFHEAKKHGDILVVSVTPDRFVNKGPGRPVFSEQLRAEAIAALDSIDFVFINDTATAVRPITAICPSIYIKGIEYAETQKDVTGKINDEIEAVKSTGGQVVYTNDIIYSSSKLLNKFFPGFPPEVSDYLNQFKKKYSADDILSYLDAAKKLKVLVIGEVIIDEYNYVNAIGKAGKEPVLVTQQLYKETYAGGILAVANHLASFCDKVECLSYVGEDNKYETFIKDQLKENVVANFVTKPSSQTIVKRRYVDEYSKQKLFEIYEMNDAPFEGIEKNLLLDKVDRIIDKYDLVVVADYGHGLLDQEAIDMITKRSKYIAVNTQANAGNHGFNCISKYKSADYVCIAIRELELTLRKKNIPPEKHIEQLTRDYDYKNLVVTTGSNGSFVYRSKEGIFSVPAFSCDVKDRVGAGDSVLALTSIFMVQGAPAEMVGFIGNVVGAEAVTIMGNKKYIENIPLKKHIVHLLK